MLLAKFKAWAAIGLLNRWAGVEGMGRAVVSGLIVGTKRRAPKRVDRLLAPFK